MTDTPPFWPDGIEGAVSLSFDDALESQLVNAIPRLDDHDLKATFYVNPGRSSSWTDNIPRWQQAARNGHEIGNHTSRHPCSCNFGFHADYCLEKLTLENIADTIDEAEAALDDLFPAQKNKRSFCYPCYQSYVGAGVQRQSYTPLVARRFRVARGGGERSNNPRIIDLSYVWAQDVRDYSGDQLIAYIERAMELGHWAIICMHGIGDEHLAIEICAFAHMVDYLHSSRDRIWTDTVIGLADYIIAQRQNLKEKNHGA